MVCALICDLPRKWEKKLVGAINVTFVPGGVCAVINGVNLNTPLIDKVFSRINKADYASSSGQGWAPVFRWRKSRNIKK